MKQFPALVVTAVAGVAAHLLVGWMSVVVAAVLGGALRGEGGWKTGLFGILIAWIGLLAWNYAVAPGPTAEMTRVMAALAGGLPWFVTPLATLIVGALLGAAGGSVGSAIRNIVR